MQIKLSAQFDSFNFVSYLCRVRQPTRLFPSLIGIQNIFEGSGVIRIGGLTMSEFEYGSRPEGPPVLGYVIVGAMFTTLTLLGSTLYLLFV